MATYESFDTKPTRSILNSTLVIVSQLRDALNEFAAQEEGLLSQIARLELRLKNAKEQHNKLKEHVDITNKSLKQQEEVVKGLQDALSPGRRLPADVLIRIFRFTVHLTEDSWKASLSRWTNTCIGNTPIVLSSVCSNWRSIVQSDSLLWAPFLIQLSKLKSTVSVSEIHRIKHWTTYGHRSQQSLILDNWNLNRHLLVEKQLSSEVTPWKRLSICVVEVPDTDTWDIERLRAHEVEIYRTHSTSLRFFEPLMRYASALTIYGPPPQWGTLPWAALKSLTIKNVARKWISIEKISFDQGEFMNLLRATPRLTDLTLDFVADWSKPPATEFTLITHFSLETISLHHNHFIENGNIFGVELVAPSLRKLTLLSIKFTNVIPQESFHCMWDAPTHLVLPPFHDHNVEVVSHILRWYPNVDTLEVKGSGVDTLFIFIHSVYHHIPPPEPMPLPRLTNLLMRNTDLRGETLIELLENRLRQVQAKTLGVSQITNITMYNSPKVSPAHWNRVEQLLSDAIKMTAG